MNPEKRSVRVYHYFLSIPDRSYPFASFIEGEKYRWRKSYEYTLAEVRAKIGEGKYGLKLSAWREMCHVVGAGIFIGVSTAVSQFFWGSNAGLPVLFITGVIAVSFQEFYLHPRHYGQDFSKSVVDWTSWVAPLGVYIMLAGF